MKSTKLTIAVMLGASLVAAAPAFADPGYRGHDYGYRGDGWNRHDRDRRVVVVRERPRYVEPRVVYVHPAPIVYPAAPVVYGPPAYGPAYGSVYYGAPAVGALFGAVLGAYVGHEIASGR
ncbi:MAG: hypothetical protein WCA09_09075 [Burkholderiales bacterium]